MKKLRACHASLIAISAGALISCGGGGGSGSGSNLIPQGLSILAGNVVSVGTLDGRGAQAVFSVPFGVAFDKQGNAFIADSRSHVIRRVTPAGDVTTVAGIPGSSGTEDGPSARARFNGPAGLTFDADGNLLIADSLNNCIRRLAVDGSVSTMAGVCSFAGFRDGLAASARFSEPTGIAVDRDGSVLVADRGNHLIRRIAPDRTVSTAAGIPPLSGGGVFGYVNGPAATARFNQPTAIVLDASGNWLISDWGNAAIRRVSTQGVVTTLAGSGGPGSADGTAATATFNGPSGLAVDSAGTVFVAEANNSVVRKVDSSGNVTTLAGTALLTGTADGTGSSARFNGLLGLAFDGSGSLLVADSFNGLLRRVSTNGQVSTVAGSAVSSGSADGTGSQATFKQPQGLTIDASGSVFVADAGNSTIRKIASDSVSTFSGRAGQAGLNDGSAAVARFSSAGDVVVDGSGNVFVADAGNSLVRQIKSSGEVITLAGSGAGAADGTGNQARFRSPQGLAIDAAGAIYVADTFNHAIRKVTLSPPVGGGSVPIAVVTTIAGQLGAAGSADGQAGSARFNEPIALTVDSAGNVFVADTGNKTVRKITPTGVVSTVAGVAGVSGAIDGDARTALFATPNGIALDSSGSLYIADSENFTIRKITASGQVSTILGSAGRVGYIPGISPGLIPVPHRVAIAGNILYVTVDHGVLTLRLP